MQGKVRPQTIEPDWARLLEAERKLEEEIAAAESDARARVAQARATAASAVPESAATARLAAAEEEADLEQQQSELARIAEEGDAAARAFAQAPESLVEELARIALAAAMTGELPAERR